MSLARTMEQMDEVRALCDRLGYGFVIDVAARAWKKKDPHGAFAVGPCLSFTRTCPCRGERFKCDRCHGCGWVMA